MKTNAYAIAANAIKNGTLAELATETLQEALELAKDYEFCAECADSYATTRRELAAIAKVKNPVRDELAKRAA